MDGRALLVHGQLTIDSAEGVQEGDPLGPSLFSLAIRNETHNMKSKLNQWYLDEVVIEGSVEDIVRDLMFVKEE